MKGYTEIYPKIDKSCVSCHVGYEKMLSCNMATRKKEKEFVKEVFSKYDKHFFKKNCNSCHLKDCKDCHKVKDNQVKKPGVYDCLKCHNGYFIGIEYIGLSLREPSIRYKRGILFKNKYYMLMKEDVHFTAGLTCADCHNMKSLLKKNVGPKICIDCHKIDKNIIEHSINAHLEKLECYTCHSAWINQEYGTYVIRNYSENDLYRERLWDRYSEEYQRSTFFVKRDLFPIGLNKKGKLSPIRPQFIFIYSDLKKDIHNKIISKTWKAIFPHTIQKGTPTCNNCHMNNGRFLQSCDNDNSVLSFFDTSSNFKERFNFLCYKGQSLWNGRFYTKKDVFKAKKDPKFKKLYIKKWDLILKDVN